MTRAAAWSTLTGESGISHYSEEIRRFPMLDRQEEYLLAKHWREDGDRDAAFCSAVNMRRAFSHHSVAANAFSRVLA